MNDTCIRGEWRTLPHLKRRHYVYDGERSMCRPTYGRQDWEPWHKPHEACPECTSYLNQARAHRAADAVANRPWACACAHCRKVRRVTDPGPQASPASVPPR